MIAVSRLGFADVGIITAAVAHAAFGDDVVGEVPDLATGAF